MKENALKNLEEFMKTIELANQFAAPASEIIEIKDIPYETQIPYKY